MEAAKPSPDSTAPSSGRRESKRRVKNTVTSPNSVDSRSRIGGPVRVLRARRTVSCRSNEVKNASYKKRNTSFYHERRRPGPQNTPVMKPTIKKSSPKKASKKKSKKGKGKHPSRVRASAATPCKQEAEIEVSSFGKKTGDSKGSNENVSVQDAALDKDLPFRDDQKDLICKPETKIEKSRRRATLQKEVKKEESEKEKGDIKKEDATKIVLQSDDGAGDNTETARKRGRHQNHEKAPRPPKQRKKPPVQYVRCEIEGCGTVLAHPRYLQHHIKYQHLLKKKYVCDHPSCGRLFRLQKQLLRHAKHHTDQRDYICEYCARAFKSSHNLAVHRMIHTGEKPIQCEICGFTCRQKASLNWHMKKHDAEASYQFSCSICGKKFEKKDSVVAHKAKSHPEVLIAEALAANGGSVISTPTPVSENFPVLTQADPTSVSQEAAGGMLAPLEQVVLPVPSQTQVNVSQSQFFQLPTHHVVQVPHQQQEPTLLHLATASPVPLSSTSHPQLIQLSTLPAGSVTSMSTVDNHSTLVTLSSVTSLATTGSLASQQAMQWGREAQEETQLPGEGRLWDRVVVGDGEMMWEGNGERRKEEEGIVWEREGERQILLQCAEAHGHGLM